VEALWLAKRKQWRKRGEKLHRICVRERIVNQRLGGGKHTGGRKCLTLLEALELWQGQRVKKTDKKRVERAAAIIFMLKGGESGK